MIGEKGEGNVLITENISLDNYNANKHVLLIGGTEDRRISSYIGPNILNTNRSFVVTDRDGVLYRRYHEALEDKGYDVKCLDFTGTDVRYSYNPFSYINSDEDAETLAEILSRNMFADEPVREAGKLIMTAVLAYIYDHTTEVNHRFYYLVYIIETEAECDDNEDCKTIIDYMFEEVKEYEKDNTDVSFAYTKYKEYREKTKKLPRRKVALSCLSVLHVFNRDNTCRITEADGISRDSIENTIIARFMLLPSKNKTYTPAAPTLYARIYTAEEDIDLESIENTRTALFVILPSEDRSYDLVATILYAHLFKFLGSRIKSAGTWYPLRMLLMPDEFTNMARIPGIGEIFSKLKDYGASVTIPLPAARALRYAKIPCWDEFTEAFDTAVYFSDTGIFERGTWFDRCLWGINPTKVPDELAVLPPDKCVVIRRPWGRNTCIYTDTIMHT